MPHPGAEAQSKGGMDSGVESSVALGVSETVLVMSPAIAYRTRRRRGGFVVPGVCPAPWAIGQQMWQDILLTVLHIPACPFASQPAIRIFQLIKDRVSL